jgi:hypothetical protein
MPAPPAFPSPDPTCPGTLKKVRGGQKAPSSAKTVNAARGARFPGRTQNLALVPVARQLQELARRDPSSGRTSPRIRVASVGKPRHTPPVEDDELAGTLHWWPLPANNSWCGAKDLHKSLMHSASHHAHLALRDFTNDDANIMADAGLHAGIAVEHLAKCYLATLHPILLLSSANDVDAILHLIGKSDLAKASPYQIKTISGEEACKRAGRFLQTFRYNEQTHRQLFITRNNASHLGFTIEVRVAVRLMVQLADPLLTAVSFRPRQFWGTYFSAVNTLRDETLSEQRAILNVKYEVARQQLARHLQGLGPTQQAAFKALIATRLSYGADYTERYPCPVCESQGWLLCHREYNAVDDETHPGGKAFVFNEAIAYPMAFRCEVCDLTWMRPIS